MRTFKQFTNLFEKISKKDITKALADTSIRIGAEFEYIDSQMENYSGGSSEYEDAASEHSQLEADIREAISNREGAYEEFVDETRTEQQEKVGEMNDEIEVLESARDAIETDYDRQIENIEDEINDDQLSLSDEEGKELYNQKDELQDQIDKLEIERDKAIDEKQEEIGEKESDRDDIEGMEYDEWWDQENSGYWSDEATERQADYGVNVGSGYYSQIVGWWLEHMGHSEDDINSAIWEYIYEDYSRSFDALGYPDGSDDDGDYSNFEDAVLGSMDLDTLAGITGVNNPDIGEYHSSADYSTWRIESDSSLGTGGVEIISEILTLKEALKIIPEMFDYIDDNGYTNSSCGFHITLSVKGTVLKDNIDLMKLILFMDEGYIIKHFPEREGNNYAKSMLQRLGQEVETVKRNADGKVKTFQTRDAQKIFKRYVNDFLPRADKFNSINWTALGEGEGRIEIRWLGGTGYHKKWKQIQGAIGRYVHYIKLALDPEYQQDEYIKKLFRMMERGEGAAGGKIIDKLQIRANDNLLKKLSAKGKFMGSIQRKGGGGSYKNILFVEMNKLVYRIQVGDAGAIFTDGITVTMSTKRDFIVKDTMKLKQWIINLGKGKYPDIRLSPKYKVK